MLVIFKACDVLEKHDSLYLDMLKQNMNDEELLVYRESEADVKRRLHRRCTALMINILEELPLFA
jgi:hypothetical protein